MNDLVKSDLTPMQMPSTEAVRAQEEVRTAITIARKFPRNEFDSQIAITNSCKRLSFAESALYVLPRGGKKIVGPSIHMAKMLAQKWGNIQYGVRELNTNEDETEVETYCWDMESNVRISRTMKIRHEMKANKVIKKLIDPADISMHVGAHSARKLRNCILDTIPEDIVQAAKDIVTLTLEKGYGEDIKTRINKMLVAFQEYGVNREQIEEKIGHKIEATIPTELVNLQQLYVSLRDGMIKREEAFNFENPAQDKEKDKAEELSRKKLANVEEGKTELKK